MESSPVSSASFNLFVLDVSIEDGSREKERERERECLADDRIGKVCRWAKSLISNGDVAGSRKKFVSVVKIHDRWTSTRRTRARDKREIGLVSCGCCYFISCSVARCFWLEADGHETVRVLVYLGQAGRDKRQGIDLLLTRCAEFCRKEPRVRWTFFLRRLSPTALFTMGIQSSARFVEIQVNNFFFSLLWKFNWRRGVDWFLAFVFNRLKILAASASI